jgi:capsular exopolysaccharide synthesis family protein
LSTWKVTALELRDYLRILRKGWILIVTLSLIGAAAAAGYSALQSPVYSSTSKVFVSTQTAGTTAELVQGSSFTVQRVKTYSDLVLTPIVLQPVTQELGIDLSEAALARSISASAPLDTSIIEITVTNVDAALASDIANSTASSLAKVVESIEVSGAADAVSPVKLTLVQRAIISEKPVSPNVPLNIILGFLIGLAMGIGVAVLRDTLDTRIRGADDVEAITDLPLLGGISFDPKAKLRPLIVHADPQSPRAEAFRALRTNLQFLDADRDKRGFVVTSTVPSEGKSTTTANLAIALADTGKNVLIVEADLRNPKITEYLDIEGAAGLTDVLIGRAELQDVIQKWGKDKLYVLPAGQIPPNPSELLGSVAMHNVVTRLEEAFDVVLYDCPPLLPVTDASILAKRVGGVILIVAAGRAQKSHLSSVISGLENVGAHISGLVLTMIPTKGPNAYGYGQYGYGYGQYGYGQYGYGKSAPKKVSRGERRKLSESTTGA